MYVSLIFADRRIHTDNVDAIDKKTYEVQKEQEEPIESIEELVEELPDNSARYVIISYPMKLSDGRIKSPLVLVYWRPPTCGQESKMLYAGGVELIRDKAGVSQYVPITTILPTLYY